MFCRVLMAGPWEWFEAFKKMLQRHRSYASMSRNADALQMQMQSADAEDSVEVSNGLRARSAGPDLCATPTAAYPCVYATGSEVCEKLKCLECPWRAYEGSGEARGAF